MSQSQHPETPGRPPALLQAVPRWCPSAWAPPAETLTWASVTVAAIASAYLFRDPLVRTLFRLPFDAFLLAAAATAIVAFVAWKGSTRPGAKYPRYWAALLSLFCLGVTIWGMADKISNPRGSPRVHALSAIGFMATVTLLPRVFRVHPYSRWVQHVAPVSLGVVVFVCLPGAYLAERKVVEHNKTEIVSKIQRLKEVSDTISSVAALFPHSSASPFPGEDQVRTLHDLTLVGWFPDQFEWRSARLLDVQEKTHLQEEMLRNASGLIQVLKIGLTSPDARRLSEPQLHAHDAKGTGWDEDRHFRDDSGVVAKYYFESARIFRELGKVIEGSPAEKEYQASKRDLENSLQNLRRSTSELWIATLIDEREPSLLELLQSEIVSSHPLGDLRGWRMLAHQEASSLLRQPGCAQDEVEFHSFSGPRVIPDTLANGVCRTKQTTTSFKRIECYAYRFNIKHDRVEMLAELHLHYDYTTILEEDCPAPGQYQKNTSTHTSSDHPVLLYFDIPPGRGQYQDDLMVALADWAREHYQVRVENLMGGTPTRGFQIHSAGIMLRATPKQIRRGKVSTVEIRIE